MARIAAIAPPGSMDRVVSDLRRKLFERWGAVSALALPSWIPLLPWPRDVPPQRAAALLAGCALGAAFELDRYVLHDGCLFLAVRCEALPEIQRRLEVAVERGAAEEESAPTDHAHLPCYPGFFLAARDLGQTPEHLEAELPLPGERRFRSYALCVCGVHSGAPPSRWWDLVSWEEEVRVAVKASGRPSAGSAAGLG